MALQRLVLRFPARLVDRPIISEAVRRFDLDFNILRANVTPREEGLLVLEILGSPEACSLCVRHLQTAGVSVEPMSGQMRRDDIRCTHCGACTGICPTHALAVDRATMMVTFDNDKCIACELCIPACPVRALQLHF